MTILLNDILNIAAPEEYKLHLACRDQDHRPLDDFVDSRDKWQHDWNESRGKRDDWKRPYVLSFMQFHPKAHMWLFGGGFEVVERRPDGYKLQSIPAFEKYVGRLLAFFHRPRGTLGRAFTLEKYLNDLTVAEVFPEPYSGESFPGCQWINHDFGTLEHLFSIGRADWKAALENVKGVYLITDKSNGKQYVGSAYGDAGIWSRWSSYMRTGHGGDAELVGLFLRNDLAYARQNFRFTLLEAMAWSTPDQAVLAREDYWKEVLLTRSEHGYNKN
jgi:hypothetical protein